MSQLNSNFWVMAEITFIERLFPSNTKTVRLTNRPAISSTPGLYMPLLQLVPSIGSKAGDFLPANDSATITIDDSHGTWGYQRRFSDFLDRYDLIGQSVTIYVAETAPDILDPESSFVAYWRGNVQTFRKNNQSKIQSFNISISRGDIPVHVVTKKITSSEFTTAPLNNLGKDIPLIFGTPIDVKPIQISESNVVSTEFAYCTTFADKAVPSGIDIGKFYVADENGDYIGAINAASNAENIVTGRDLNANATQQAWKTNETERTIKFFSLGTNYVGVGLRMYFHDNSNATRDGILRFKVLRAKQPGGFPSAANFYGEEVISKEVKHSDLVLLGSYGGFNVYYADIVFDSPLAMDGQDVYSLSISNTGTAGNIRPINDSGTTSTSSGLFQWWRDGNNVWTSLGAEGSPYIGFYCLKWGETVSPSASAIDDYSGLGHAKITTTIKAAFTDCDVGKMDILLQVNGLKDSSTGFFTGINNQEFNRAVYICDLLTSTWDGTAWVPATNFDRTKFSNTHSPTGFDVVIAGRTSGSKQAKNLLSEILQNCFSQVVSEGGAVKNLGLYGYGYPQTSVATIDDEDAKVSFIEYQGTATIVNRCLMYYDNQIDEIKDVRPLSNDGTYKEYQASYDSSSDASLVLGLPELIKRSQQLYGVRNLRIQSFDFLSLRADTPSGSTSAKNVARKILEQYTSPDIIVKFVIPYYKYSTLKIFDVVILSHPDLPSHLGTSSSAHLPMLSGAGVDITRGEYFKRAKDYRLLIEGLELQLVAGEIPTLELTCKVIYEGNQT